MLKVKNSIEFKKASLKLENIENQLIRTLKEVIGFFLIMNSTFLIIEKT